MDKQSPRAQAPAGWREALDRSEAQAAAGEFVSGEDIMRELRESIVRMEAGRADDPPRPGCPSLSLIARRLQATAAANGMTADVQDELMQSLAHDDGGESRPRYKRRAARGASVTPGHDDK